MDVRFEIGQNGLGRIFNAGTDHISGLVFYNASKPTGFSVDKIKAVYSLAEAELLGVTAEAFAAEHYQISEFFRIQPSAKLWVSFNEVPVSYDFNEVVDLQYFANGEIKQVGVYANALTFASTQVQALNAKADLLDSEAMPLVVVYTANFSTLNKSTLVDLSTTNSQYVAVSIAKDSEAAYNALGVVLGSISKNSVADSVAYVAENNLVGATELVNPALATGELIKTLSKTELQAIDSKGYIYAGKKRGVDGTFLNGSRTATSPTSDLAYIENVRVIQKAMRVVRAAVVGELGAKLRIEKDGSLAHVVIEKFNGLVTNALESMKVVDEVSEFKVSIDKKQNVLSTSVLKIGVAIVPFGIARQIVVPISFSVKA
jgi:hypothetical protein